MKHRMLLCAAALAVLAGCGQQKAPDAQQAAETALRALYTADAGTAETLETALADGDTAALEEQLRAGLDGGITDAGVQAAMENRLPTRAASQWPGQAVTVQDLTLTPSHSATDTEQYFTYTLTAGPEEGESGAEFSGEIALTLQDGVWLVDSVN